MNIGKLFKDAWGLFVKDIGPLIVGMVIAGILPTVAGILASFALVFGALPDLLSTVAEYGASPDYRVLGWTGAVVAIIAVVVALVSCPLYAGVARGALRRVREGREMGYWDALDGFHAFGRVVGTYALAYVAVPLAVMAVPVVVIVAGATGGSSPIVVTGALLLIPAVMIVIYLEVCWVYALLVVMDKHADVLTGLRESRALTRRGGWWWTFSALFLLQLAAGVASSVVGFIPGGNLVATLLVSPYLLTFLVAMYFQSRREDWLIDEALRQGVPQPDPNAPPVHSAPPTPWTGAPPAAPSTQPSPWPAAPPAPPPGGVAGGVDSLGTAPAEGPAPPEAPAPPEPPAGAPGPGAE